MIVIDSSSAVDTLLGSEFAEDIDAHVRAHDYDLHAPHLIDAEIGQAIRGHSLAGALDGSDAERALIALEQIPIERYAHRPLLMRAFDLRSNVTFYDALYLALAEALEATLLTRDAELAKVALGTVDVALVR
jgi:predicted nucleic acid-binding protein